MKSFGTRVVNQLYRCLQHGRVQGQRRLLSTTYSQKKMERKNNHHFKEISTWETPFSINNPEFDWTYLSDSNNLAEIKENIERRKGIGDIEKLQETWRELQTETDIDKMKELKERLNQLAADIPNSSSNLTPIGDESEAKLIEIHGKKKDFTFQPKSHVEIGKNLGLLRTEWKKYTFTTPYDDVHQEKSFGSDKFEKRNVSLTTGTSTYYFLGDLAQLEQALVQYTLHTLISSGFSVVTVPDIIHPSVIEGCGFKTTGEITQVYRLDKHNLCLAGTAEMPLAGYFMNEVVSHKELPTKICAVSRCYRAETSTVEEGGIYRVHQFTKVEMFGITNGSPEMSSKLMTEFLDLQIQLFTGLGIHFRVLEMPTQELGAPAHRKIDIEAWMPHNEFWGEISSTSDCTDFQSRRLSMKYQDDNDQLFHCYTVNGTACAIPRMIMYLLETNQTENGNVYIPEALQPWMDGKDRLTGLGKQMKYYQANRLDRMKS